MSQHNLWVVIPASGIGSRMQADKPKQYMPFLSSTVIEQTLDRLLSFEHIKGAVVVLSKEDGFWSALNYQHKKPVITTMGAAERSGSVLNGLSQLKQSALLDNLWVMIHDAVRPCVTHGDLKKLVDQSECNPQGVFLAHPITDTLKRSDTEGACVETVNRESLWRAFTPQMFPFALIYEALKNVSNNKISITDDVSALEHINKKPKIVLGRSDNIKITYPQDLLVAEFLIKNQ